MTVLRWLRAFAAFWVDFVIGDDWTVAATVAGALAVTGGLVSLDLPAWWLLPIAVLAAISLSLRRTSRRG